MKIKFYLLISIVVLFSTNKSISQDTTCIKLPYFTKVGCTPDPDGKPNEEFDCPITICIEYNFTNCQPNECGLNSNTTTRICNTIQSTNHNGGNSSDFCFIDNVCISACETEINSITISRGVGETISISGSIALRVYETLTMGANNEFCWEFTLDCQGRSLLGDGVPPAPDPSGGYCTDVLCLSIINGIPTFSLNR